MGRKDTHRHTDTDTDTNTNTHAHTHTHAHARTHTHTHTHAHAHTHTHPHAHFFFLTTLLTPTACRSGPEWVTPQSGGKKAGSDVLGPCGSELSLTSSSARMQSYEGPNNPSGSGTTNVDRVQYRQVNKDVHQATAQNQERAITSRTHCRAEKLPQSQAMSDQTCQGYDWQGSNTGPSCGSRQPQGWWWQDGPGSPCRA